MFAIKSFFKKSTLEKFTDIGKGEIPLSNKDRISLQACSNMYISIFLINPFFSNIGIKSPGYMTSFSVYCHLTRASLPQNLSNLILYFGCKYITNCPLSRAYSISFSILSSSNNFSLNLSLKNAKFTSLLFFIDDFLIKFPLKYCSII